MYRFLLEIVKCLLLPLLAAVALPSAVKAEVVTYKCIAKYHFYINGEEEIPKKDQAINFYSFDLKNNIAALEWGTFVGSQKKENKIISKQFGLPVIITDNSFIVNLHEVNRSSLPKQKIIVEVGRIDKTFKQFHKYLRLDKKSPEFDKAFYKAVRKNKDTRFFISNTGYKSWGDCEKIKTRTNHSLPTEESWSNEFKTNLYELGE